MDSLLFYVPLYLGLGFAIFGIFYRRRHPDSPRGLRVMILSFTVALIACLGTSAVSLGTQIADGATGLIVPLLLMAVLGLLSLLTVRRALRGKPSTTEAAEHAERRSSARMTLILATIAALPAYGAGYGAGTWLMVIYPNAPQLNLILGVAAASAVVLALVPWVVVEIRAAARRRAVANGHPASPEIVEHVMTKAKVARLDSLMGYGQSPYRTVIFGGIAVFAILALPAIMQILVTQLETLSGTASSIDMSLVQAISIVVVLVAIVAGLIVWFLVPTLREANTELLLSALSPEQRLRWAVRANPALAGRHRFPDRLTDPRRSIRVLTIGESGVVVLEEIPAGDLLLEHSESLDGSDDEGYLEDLVDDDGQPDVEDVKILRVLIALVNAAGHQRFDIFELEHSRQGVHVVAVGDDDYLDFPEDLARSLATA